MKRVVSFYEKLPRGPAPELKPRGLLGKYEYKHFGGKNASARPIIHAVAIVLAVGYPMTYYFHLRK
jgi:F-type H+-transporting ATPase subunit f